MAQPSSRLAPLAPTSQRRTERGVAALGFEALRWATLAAAVALSPLHGWARLLPVAASGLLGWWLVLRAAVHAA